MKRIEFDESALNTYFPCALTDEDQSLREILWTRIDSHKNPLLPTTELQSYISKKSGPFSLFLTQKAPLASAISIAKEKVLRKDSPNYLHFSQFRIFLLYLRRFLELRLWLNIKGDPNITLPEFKKSLTCLQKKLG
jgi:hypothetical protein